MADVILKTQAKAHGGRDGHVKSDNGVIDFKLAMPKKGQEVNDATNPEQLFAAGYSACFDGALNLMAQKAKKEIESEIEAEVSLVKDESDGGFKIAVTLNALVQGVSDDEAKELVHKAHQFCPYSKATAGNVDVTLNVKTK
ncbi:organic hydroperoxide resistance protein [Alkalihalobacillus trypoxylicola]|uniref:Organic hydroperoxide resistance protein OhrA n=1 Tax=Alkalihalobacillus trypoxylicola TaxID=519424 RepID=A0A162DSE1_9BACI|nr:organic hydroperoxide resistance protein [Alkalihalobacillus trypoxylicola]KYG30704.1 Organic hydroperoxide resistance protein OhrA [Alkalihalobacillus trypoxylicola]GAF66728.1 organic hydroperoxide resistance protein [Bacillus sp. TS-2]